MNTDAMVYESDRVLYSCKYAIRIADYDQAQEFIDGILESKYFVKEWPSTAKRKIKVKSSKRYDWAGARVSDNIILAPFWALNNLVLIHELAHFCAAREKKEDHGPIFCEAYLKLVTKYISKEAGRALKLSFMAHNVEF